MLLEISHSFSLEFSLAGLNLGLHSYLFLALNFEFKLAFFLHGDFIFSLGLLDNFNETVLCVNVFYQRIHLQFMQWTIPLGQILVHLAKLIPDWQLNIVLLVQFFHKIAARVVRLCCYLWYLLNFQSETFLLLDIEAHKDSFDVLPFGF